MVCRVVYLSIAVLVLSCAAAMASDTGKEVAAVAAAEKWLAIVDAGDYSESWKEAAGLFKNAVKPEQWEQSMQAVRKPLGKLIYRNVLMKIYKNVMPGAPDGEYVVIQFKTSFESQQAAIETVTPMMDKDGKWRVSGYFIK